ncbi:MAG: HlyD family efflux transporter periplasmic adaptor subunit [Hydrotalea flava]|uniref:efflux RND transporter periplasmic adaptor subunit n=1 Tax=Hydrotalea TaxID=1004300 RepID=UPI001C445C7D|nr:MULTISPECIES: biotin/lipoyl-binding protein [Hydrotalea]MBY0348082.1 HlyD family efflux transporter periplasmic adaptor subunit [Hydrotalea flava]
MMLKKYILVSFFAFAMVMQACKEKTPDANTTLVADAATGTPVTITHPIKGMMQETVTLNAVSAFLLKSFVKANANGYLQQVNIHLGQYVQKGETLFVITTKEARALGNTINALDTSLRFSGTIAIHAPGNGYITQLNYHAGDYVLDGEPLAAITDNRSFVFLLDLPYELKPYLPQNKMVHLLLPDGTQLTGTMGTPLPTVDPAAQTQNFIIRVNTNKQIPENLIAKVNLIKVQKMNTLSLPKAAVLSDEVQSNFWVMKMIDSITAIKVQVQKGVETNDAVEIITPAFKTTDSILVKGNYGLPDTAKVMILSTPLKE